MANGVNKVILIGNLGKDPEVRSTESGRKVANFPIATTEVYKDRNGEKNERTEWHNIVMWSPTAEIVEKYLRKGNKIYIEGRLQTRSYEDKEGVKKYMTEVIGQNMKMLGGPSGGGAESSFQEDNESQSQEAPANVSEGNQQQTDDLPF